MLYRKEAEPREALRGRGTGPAAAAAEAGRGHDLQALEGKCLWVLTYRSPELLAHFSSVPEHFDGFLPHQIVGTP